MLFFMSIAIFLHSVIHIHQRNGLTLSSADCALPKRIQNMSIGHPRPFVVYKLTSQSQIIYKVVGRPDINFLRLPSGPPVYIANHHGKVLDWTPDIGEGPSFCAMWNACNARIALPNKDAEILIRKLKANYSLPPGCRCKARLSFTHSDFNETRFHAHPL
jgi:hypothetical protein